VVVCGGNVTELPDLVRLTIDYPRYVRFIDLMPIGNTEDWGAEFPGCERYNSVQEMRDCLAPLNLPAEEAPAGHVILHRYRSPSVRPAQTPRGC
jgi:molybdenum cofactor biosynthesis enzyme MoaA